MIMTTKKLEGIFIRKLILFGIVYRLGVYGLSFSWFLVAFILYCLLQAFEATYPKHEVIRATLEKEEDKEDVGAKWINDVIKQMWPKIGKLIERALVEEAEPIIKSNFENLEVKKLHGFKFKNVDMGQIPPKFTKPSVTDKESEIILDVNVVMFSDCSISFELASE